MRKPKVSARKRERLLEEYKRSGMSAAAFARKHRINYTTFCSWRKRLLKSEQKDRPNLVEVEVESDLGDPIEIRVGELSRMQVGNREQARLAATVIRELEGTGC